MHTRRARLIGLAFLLALFIGVGTALAAGNKICSDSGSCHQCDYHTR